MISNFTNFKFSLCLVIGFNSVLGLWLREMLPTFRWYKLPQPSGSKCIGYAAIHQQIHFDPEDGGNTFIWRSATSPTTTGCNNPRTELTSISYFVSKCLCRCIEGHVRVKIRWLHCGGCLKEELVYALASETVEVPAFFGIPCSPQGNYFQLRFVLCSCYRFSILLNIHTFILVLSLFCFISSL
jgi:hypothetical protein